MEDEIKVIMEDFNLDTEQEAIDLAVNLTSKVVLAIRDEAQITFDKDGVWIKTEKGVVS